MLKLLKELCAADGVSGFETPVRKLIAQKCRPYADEMHTDVMGNLIVFKKGKKHKGPKVMLAAHMDEVGFLITKIEDSGVRSETRPETWFGVLPITVRRNAYGRQLGSFRTVGQFDGKPNVPMTFIRAPAITAVSPGVEVLSRYDGLPTAVRWRGITAFTLHPELMTGLARA